MSASKLSKEKRRRIIHSRVVVREAMIDRLADLESPEGLSRAWTEDEARERVRAGAQIGAEWMQRHRGIRE